jgi:outer membrane protein insertion porin family
VLPRRVEARIRRILAATVLVLAAAGASPAPAQEQFPTELLTLSDVHFQGRHSVSVRELKSVMKTKPPSSLPWRDHPRLRRDFLRADTLAIETLYHQHGYLDARVHAVIRPGGGDSRSARVTFVIEEGRRSRIRDVEFGGLEACPPEVLQRAIYARPGRPFNPAYLIADTSRIADAYHERGYFAHAVGSMRRDTSAVTVRYDVLEGPHYRFGSVRILTVNALHVDESLVRREVLMRPGDPYRRSRVERTLEQLYETGLFSQAQITQLRDSAGGAIHFDLRVVERKARWLDVGMGSGTRERFRFTGEWGHHNLAGKGLNGVLGTRLAFNHQFKFLLTRTSASLVEPWLFHTRTRGGVSLYHELSDNRDREGQWVVRQETKGITFQAYRTMGRQGRVTLTQDNSFVLQNLREVNPFLDEQTLDSVLTHLKPSYSTHRLTLSGLRDRRDDLLYASRGSMQTVSAEVAGGPLQGASSFHKLLAASSWYTPTRRRWVLATRVTGGIMRPFGSAGPFTPEPGVDPEVARVPLEDRFRLGGVNSVRGFDENDIAPSGGLAMVLANAELRIPVAGPFGLEIFIDTGNVWERAAYIKADDFLPHVGNTVPDRGDMRYVFGAGGTLMLPFGPLRIDCTWSPRPVAVDPRGRPIWFVFKPQFAIGPSF